MLAGGALALPAWAQRVSPGLEAPVLPSVSGTDIKLDIGHAMVSVDGRTTHAVAVNGSVPGPLLRLREGQNVRLSVTNDLDEDSSIHWHGLLLPAQFDGVPGVSFPGIKPRSTFVYEFPIRQSGTYWYHSHSGLQEMMGHYGPIVIDPAGTDRAPYDREHVLVLSDHSVTHPHSIYRNLKLQPGYYNEAKQTLAGLLAGQDQPAGERLDWAGMLMDPTDISDATATTFTYVVNGYGPADNWTALFRPGERVRLRVINAAGMTIFNLRIPGLALTVVGADGLDVQPVTVDELQIAVAETYDIVVTPTADTAYTIVAETIDRSGMARATLAPRPGMVAPVPPLRARPLLTMTDMGMGAMGGGGMAGMDHGSMDHDMRDGSIAPQVKMGPGVQMISPMPTDRTGEPGTGLTDVGHKVLTYRDLKAAAPNPDTRAPSRAMELHLTGNMERYMWSFDGVAFTDARHPIPFIEGERVRITLVNDTMMNHPIHLHGHFFELVTGHGDHAPRKHTVNVQPGGLVSFDFTADALGDWAFHCHMLLHMHAGMMRIVSVRPA